MFSKLHVQRPQTLTLFMQVHGTIDGIPFDQNSSDPINVLQWTMLLIQLLIEQQWPYPSKCTLYHSYMCGIATATTDCTDPTTTGCKPISMGSWRNSRLAMDCWGVNNGLGAENHGGSDLISSSDLSTPMVTDYSSIDSYLQKCTNIWLRSETEEQYRAPLIVFPRNRTHYYTSN